LRYSFVNVDTYYCWQNTYAVNLGMKKIILTSLVLALCIFCKAQTYTNAQFILKASFTEIKTTKLLVDDIAFEIDAIGNLTSYNYTLGGKYEYYDRYQNTDNIGKIKSVGNIKFEYYDRYGDADNIGKIKSIGNVKIDYYNKFSSDEKLGKVKSIGDVKIDYYDRFDDKEKFEKIKSIGNLQINYYDRFDAVENRGKLKSIGNIKINFYDNNDDIENRGRLKSIEGNTSTAYATV
jgi:hypothetical protein